MKTETGHKISGFWNHDAATQPFQIAGRITIQLPSRTLAEITFRGTTPVFTVNNREFVIQNWWGIGSSFEEIVREHDDYMHYDYSISSGYDARNACKIRCKPVHRIDRHGRRIRCDTIPTLVLYDSDGAELSLDLSGAHIGDTMHENTTNNGMDGIKVLRYLVRVANHAALDSYVETYSSTTPFACHDVDRDSSVAVISSETCTDTWTLNFDSLKRPCLWYNNTKMGVRNDLLIRESRMFTDVLENAIFQRAVGAPVDTQAHGELGSLHITDGCGTTDATPLVVKLHTMGATTTGLISALSGIVLYDTYHHTIIHYKNMDTTRTLVWLHRYTKQGGPGPTLEYRRHMRIEHERNRKEQLL